MQHFQGLNITNLSFKIDQISSERLACIKGSDCPAGYCCIALNQPIGKRQINNKGYCSPLPKFGEACLVSSKKHLIDI